MLNTHGSLPPLLQKVMVDKFWSVKRTQIINVHVCVVQSTAYMRLKKNIHGTKAIENKTNVDWNFFLLQRLTKSSPTVVSQM